MCGINGLLNFHHEAVEPETLHHMGLQMIHRGPDDQGVWMDHHVGLGFRRLSIIDTEEGQQPLTNEDENVWMVCNGEIYNYRSLREELCAQGHQFRTGGDTETILHLYEEYGTDCVHHLRGMYAFIIWDRRSETFFAARDHFGIKPFYYTYDNDRLVCSSELKSLIRVSEHSRLDRQSLLHYLTFQYVPEPRTMVEGIWKLPPAHQFIVHGKEMQVERYWQPTFKPQEQATEEKVREDIRTTLQDSVKVHMQSDVPLGSFLSSGIDSTAIAALMRQEGPVHTFSVGFEGKHNECDISRQTAKALDTNHHEWVIGEQDYFDAVQHSIWSQDDPVADPSAIALRLLSQFASEHVKVVLSGEGADELFGGYGIYQEPFALRYLQWMPQGFKDTLHTAVHRMPHFYGKNYILRATTPLQNRYVGNAKIFTDDVYDVMHENDRGYYGDLEDAFQWARQYYNQVQGLDEVTQMQYIDLNLWLPGNILAKGDKMSMAHSLELRVPFLDRHVFNVAGRIPTQYRVDAASTKRILRESLQGIVPDHVLNRPKLGFPVPLRKWLMGKRRDECLSMIRSSGLAHYIHMDYVEQLVQEHQSGKFDHARKIWALYTLAQWHDLFLEDFQPVFGCASAEREKILV